MANWLKTLLYTLLAAALIGCGGWVLSHETEIAVIEERVEANKEDIIDDKEKVEYLQKTQNATHEMVTIIDHDLKGLKSDVEEDMEEIKRLLKRRNRYDVADNNK